jgi:hypothetical protein
MRSGRGVGEQGSREAGGVAGNSGLLAPYGRGEAPSRAGGRSPAIPGCGHIPLLPAVSSFLNPISLSPVYFHGRHHDHP